MPTEQIYWHKGLSFDARSALQQAGYLAVAKNIDFTVEGKQGLRPPFAAINSTAIGSVHSLAIFRGNIIAGSGSSLWRSVGAEFTEYPYFTDNPWIFREYKDFLHGTNGTDSVFIDEFGNMFPAKLDYPTTGPTMTDSGGGAGPSGTYAGYVSYYITWPNGMTYETGFSPAGGDLAITDNTITWSNIPICPYGPYDGTAPAIHRKLYRGPGSGGSLADIYFVDVIEDNQTTTYSDSFTDVQLAAAGASDVDTYGPMLDYKFIEYHYGRLNGIETANPHRLDYSEPAGGETSADNETIMPVAVLEDNYDDVRVPGLRAKIDPTGLIAWGTNLFIPIRSTWIRRQGNDPETWSYKKTYASYGICAPHTIGISNQPSGIIGLAMIDSLTPGIAIFNGQTSEILSSPKLDSFLTDINLTYIANCRGGVSGKRYHLLYPSAASTDGQPDKHLVVDLRRSPDIRVAYWDGLNSRCLAVDDSDKTLYIGGTDGYVYKMGTVAESIDMDIATHYMIGNDPKAANKVKQWKQLKYNLDTNGASVTLEVYIDGALATWPDGTTSHSISGTGDDVQILPLPQNFEGYQIKVRVYGTALTQCDIYSPWDLDFDITA